MIWNIRHAGPRARPLYDRAKALVAIDKHLRVGNHSFANKRGRRAFPGPRAHLSGRLVRDDDPVALAMKRLAAKTPPKCSERARWPQ